MEDILPPLFGTLLFIAFLYFGYRDDYRRNKREFIVTILTEEVGEVARLMARIYGEQSFKRKEDEATAKEDLADEMADVMFVLICLANQTGIDLTEAMTKNLDKKTKRDKERHANNEKLK